MLLNCAFVFNRGHLRFLLAEHHAVDRVEHVSIERAVLYLHAAHILAQEEIIVFVVFLFFFGEALAALDLRVLDDLGLHQLLVELDRV